MSHTRTTLPACTRAKAAVCTVAYAPASVTGTTISTTIPTMIAVAAPARLTTRPPPTRVERRTTGSNRYASRIASSSGTVTELISHPT
ncbi:MAG: hypothetical protein C0468_01255 [Planctomyces sp.]|nr:hypothetical protein [Planctomyces sp.]MBA4120092.1 hypothetical protein [Isosphaera sp.]